MPFCVDRSKFMSLRMAYSVMRWFGPSQMQWHYEHGLVLQSIFLLGLKTGREDLCSYVKSMYDTVISPKGRILTYRGSDFNLDQINPGKTLILLYEKYGEEKYNIAIETLRDQIRNHPKTNSGGYWHKLIYPYQMWLDGLYMHMPFYAKYSQKYDIMSDFNDIVFQFMLITTYAKDKKTGLLYHAWDESRQEKWANPNTGCSSHFWGRAMGWYCMALVDTLEFFPKTLDKQYLFLKEISKDLIPVLLKYQDEQSGLWYQVMDRGGDKDNYTETSASSMFIYFLLKMIRLGLISNKFFIIKLKKIIKKAYNGLLEHKLQEDNFGGIHLIDICKVAGLGGTPYRDGSYEYYVSEPAVTDDFKGLGPFILASMEMEEQGMAPVTLIFTKGKNYKL